MEKTTNEKKLLLVGVISTFVLGFALGGIFTTLNNDDTASRYNYNGGNTFYGGSSSSGGVPVSINLNNLKTLDLDGNGEVRETDTKVIMSYLYNVRSFNLNSVSDTQVINHLDSMGLKLDIDGNGKLDALTDGLLLTRVIINTQYGMKLNKEILDGVLGKGATRRDIYSITNYIKNTFSNGRTINSVPKLEIQNLKKLDVNFDKKVSLVDARLIISFLFDTNKQTIGSLNKNLLDIDGNGKTDALTDGMIIYRLMTSFNPTQSTLNGVIGSGAKRKNIDDIIKYVNINFK